MSSAKILIVEDEAIVALDIQARLIRLGHQVAGIASSGEEAIRLAEASLPDLALMDIRLRGKMDGVATAHQLRVRFDVPVVYLTAYGDDATLQRAKITEPFGFLIKPFEERELHGTIEMALYKIQMQKRLQQHSAQLQRIISTLPEGVALLDAENRIVMANPRAQEYLMALGGVGIGEVLQKLGDMSTDQLVSVLDHGLWQEIPYAGPPQRTFEATTTSGSGEFAHGAAEENSLDRLLVIRDVTTERQIQERIRLHERLAAIGQFAAGIAHDFNNIMTTVVIYAELMQTGEPNLTPQSRERLESIVQQAKHATDLIKQLLGFSRASRMEVQPVDIVPLVKEEAQMLQRLIPQNIQLKLVYQPGDYVICGDATQILQVLMNLTLNARDAMPNGGELCIELARCSGEEIPLDDIKADSEWITIRISDTGAGIDPDDLPHIFEPFFTTKAPGKGTGLGLAQVHGIVQQHGGYVYADSCIGKGSTFSVFLPAQTSASTDDVDAATGFSPPVQGNHHTIMVVEDDPVVRQSICELLGAMDYQIFAASNGCEALALLESCEMHVDLILSDLVMPEMGGVELCRELRTRKLDTKIIVMSGYFSQETREQLRPLFIASYLNKPLRAERLFEAIEDALVTESSTWAN